MNLNAYYLVRGLKGLLKWRIRYAQYLHNERIARANAPPQPRATPPPRDTSQYRNRLSTPEKTKSDFTYKWLKTAAELKQTCRDTEDAPETSVGDDDCDCECLITLMDLESNHAFSVSYKDSNGKTHTDCFHEIVIDREEAKQYTYFRHPILRDQFINMQAIRALKTTSAAAPVQEGGKLHRRPTKRT